MHYGYAELDSAIVSRGGSHSLREALEKAGTEPRADFTTECARIKHLAREMIMQG